jgi:hypothetical protein
VIENSSRKAFLPAANSAPRPGDFRIGSAASRAAARMLLRSRKTAAEQEADRPPDIRGVFDLNCCHPSPAPSWEYADRYTDSDGRIVEIIFPAHPHASEHGPGVYEVPPMTKTEFDAWFYGRYLSQKKTSPHSFYAEKEK